MGDLWTLILLCLAMLIGCFLAGLVPLTISFSEVFEIFILNKKYFHLSQYFIHLHVKNMFGLLRRNKNLC